MAADGQIVFEITADGKKAIASVRDVTEAIKKESGKWESSANSSAAGIESSFLSMAKKVAAGISAAGIGKALLDIGKSAIDAASDLEEVQNVVDVTFGDNATQIESWAKKAGSQFGLTETKAKQFTSTLGAMMKSAGMSGDEIVTMSTDLAGLAADMASFYNLDFETAFQKIRSGISGETEPLKQLGVNMSVANLEAFALEKGITKAFNSMSQSEQTLLRYQYLMQATADAQGDFARTSDGFANAQRRIETSIESIKTSLGTTLMPVIADATAGIAGFLEKLTANPGRTVIDEFNDIDISTEEKVAQITSTAEQARALVGILESIKTSTVGKDVQKIADDLAGIDLKQDKTKILQDFLEKLNGNISEIASVTGEDSEGVQEWLHGIAEKAAELDPDDVTGWGTLIQEITEGIPGLENTGAGKELLNTLQGIAGTKAGESVKALADEMEKIDTSQGRTAVLGSFLSTLRENVDKISEITGKDAEGAEEWIAGIAEAANGLEDGTAGGWAELVAAITTELPGLEDTEGGKSVLEALGGEFSQLGREGQDAAANLAALGIRTDDVTDKNALWLETCKKLVQTLPGLASIINTETGEVKGGTQAIRDYITAWEQGQTKLAMMQAVEKKKSALSTKYSELPGLELDMIVAQRRVRENAKALKALFDQYGVEYDPNNLLEYAYPEELTDPRALDAAVGEYANLVAAEKSATDAFNTQQAAYDEAVLALKEYEETVNEMPGTIDAAGAAMEDFGGRNSEAWNTAITSAKEAIKSMTDYAKGVRDATASSVNSIISGFSQIEKAGDENQRKLEENKNKLAEAEQKYAKLLDGAGGFDYIASLDENSDAWKKLSKEVQDAYNEIAKLRNEQTELNKSANEYKPEGMKANLQSQIDYMNEYLENLKKAREMGLSDELLASLSDGSTKSAQYLAGLVSGEKEAAQEVDRLYKEVQAKKTEFSNELANQKLTVDEVYQELVTNAKAAVEELKLGQEAAAASGETVAGIATGISSHVPDVKEAVDSLLTELDRLNGWGISLDFGSFGSFNFSLDIPQHETGLDRVPFDGYLASLHEGEGILTAEENRVWQRFKNGTSSGGMDYDALGGVMRDNVKPGGDVYLDGRVVGSVISQQQANSYRSLQRSGWQS